VEGVSLFQIGQFFWKNQTDGRQYACSFGVDATMVYSRQRYRFVEILTVSYSALSMDCFLYDVDAVAVSDFPWAVLR
jgi:hypothetical protein